MKPRHTDIKINHTTYFNCSTDIAFWDIFWFHGKNYVYTGYVLLEPYHERFAIDRSERNGTYIYNLVIRSVQASDAGEYICIDDEGFGEQYAAQLVVLGEGVSVSLNIQQNYSLHLVTLYVEIPLLI